LAGAENLATRLREARRTRRPSERRASEHHFCGRRNPTGHLCG
jgi:hypothetical protein